MKSGTRYLHGTVHELAPVVAGEDLARAVLPDDGEKLQRHGNRGLGGEALGPDVAAHVVDDDKDPAVLRRGIALR